MIMRPNIFSCGSQLIVTDKHIVVEGLGLGQNPLDMMNGRA